MSRTFVTAVLVTLISVVMTASTQARATQLISAVMSHNMTELRHELASGTNVNDRDNAGKTALVYAAEFGFTDAADLLLAYGANPNVEVDHADIHGDRRSVLDIALENRHPDVAAVIYARISGKSRSAVSDLLIDAVANKDTNSTRDLLERGADPNTIAQTGTWTGYWALEIAVCQGDIGLVRLLVTHGANVNLRNIDGQTPVMISLRANSDTTILKYLLKRNAWVNGWDFNGNTPLAMAALDSVQAVKLLLQYGADPLVRTQGGNQLPYEIALASHNNLSAKVLLQAMQMKRHPR